MRAGVPLLAPQRHAAFVVATASAALLLILLRQHGSGQSVHRFRRRRSAERDLRQTVEPGRPAAVQLIDDECSWGSCSVSRKWYDVGMDEQWKRHRDQSPWRVE